MKITFLGTGADDWDWKTPSPGVRQSTCTLFGSSCLVDAGPGVLRGLADAGASPAKILDLLVTHSHSDHLNVDNVLAISRAGRRRLRVWASPQALALLAPAAAAAGTGFEARPLAAGGIFRVAGMAAAALPANHVVMSRPDEQPLHYVFVGRGVRLLYALDGGWFCAKARIALRSILRGAPLTAIVWDATCGNTFRDWRFAEHNDLKMIDAMRESMLRDGLVSDSTVHVFDHVARTLWPASPAAQRRLVSRFGGILAEDGLTLDLPASGRAAATAETPPRGGR